ncbi:signal peptidase I [Vagococcus xieshaowenii]|nr:signal peptidase I [Vagococcus xieshaowenii]
MLWGLLGCLVLGMVYQFDYHPVKGRSMSPTIESGEGVLLKKHFNVTRYDLVAFRSRSEDKLLVKRVIGMPGDRVIVSDHQLMFIPDNGTNLGTTLTFELKEEVAQRLKGLTTLPEAHYFVVGDNQALSNDSRHFGLVEADQLTGQVVLRLAPLKKAGLVH